MYGDTGYLYVMLYARYLSEQGRRVLVVDRSEERSIHSRLPLPKESIDCLYYQGVDYLITMTRALLPYDVCLCYWGEKPENRPQKAIYGDGGQDRTEGSSGKKASSEKKFSEEAFPEGIIFTDWSRPHLSWALDLALERAALLIVTGVPGYGYAKKLLRRMEVRLSPGQLIELPWRIRDARVLLALEHGMNLALRRLSRESRKLLRFLSEQTDGEVEAYDCGLLE